MEIILQQLKILSTTEKIAFSWVKNLKSKCLFFTHSLYYIQIVHCIFKFNKYIINVNHYILANSVEKNITYGFQD